MNLLKIVALLLTISGASAFYQRRLRNDTLQQQQENEAGVYSRIYNGHPATHLEQFPYQVGLHIIHANLGYGTCGGSLISINYVLTAAHCVEHGIGIVVYVETLALSTSKIKLHLEMDDVTAHKGYVGHLNKHDIAVIKIPKVKLSRTIKLINLPPHSDNLPSYDDAETVVAGWGATSASSHDDSSELMYTTFKVITNRQCATFFGHHAIDNSILCADASRSSGCTGDSGSPLALVDNKDEKTQIGIYSTASEKGCESGEPNVFLRTDFYWQWIIDNTDLNA